MPRAYEENGAWLKRCSHCKEIKMLDGFADNRTTPDGKEYWCRKCRLIPPVGKRRAYEKDGQWIKECSRCHEHKSVDQFAPFKRAYDGMNSHCHACQGLYAAASKQRKIDKIGRAAFLVEQAAIKREFTRRNPEYKERQQEHSREYHARPEIKVKTYARTKARMKTDPAFRLSCLLRRQVNEGLRGTKKAASTKQLLGCTWNEFKAHVESLWTEGMTWDNWGLNEGDWSMDHILPCRLFDMTYPSHQRACFHYMNVRPMWHKDNIVKQDVLDDGRKARYLTPEERRVYLTAHGYGHLFD